MSYNDQKLLNAYPSWTKARKDPSSLTYRIISTLNKYYNGSLKDSVQAMSFSALLKEVCSYDSLRRIDLTEEDYIRKTYNGNHIAYTYPIVIATDSTDTVPLTRVNSVPELFHSLPDRIIQAQTYAVDEWSLWASEDPSAAIPNIFTAERLCVLVENSTFYYRELDKTEEDKVANPVGFVHLIGEDENAKPISEYIRIRDDGLYSTRNIFSKLLQVTYDGFNGRVEVFLTNSITGLIDTYELESLFSQAVSLNDSGPLKYYLMNIDSTPYFVPCLQKKAFGYQYRREGVGGLESENLEALAEQLMLDENSEPISPISMAENPLDARLYVLDSTGRVHIYEPDYTPFDAGDEPFGDTYVEVIPNYPRTSLGQEEKLWTWFRVPTVAISSVSIRRVSPSGVESYLQEDLTWGSTEYKFPGKFIQNEFPEKSWEDFSFTNTYDELGPWYFYTKVVFAGNAQRTFTSKVGVMCEYLKALRSFDLETEAEMIFFNKENKLCLRNGSTYTAYDLKHDVYIADVNSNTLFLKENYESIEVNYD